MATKNSKTAKGGMRAAEVGAGLAAAGALAAAGYYFYASKDAKKHQKQAAKWATGFKNEVVREAKALQKVDAASVARAVDTAAAAYAGVRSIDRADLNRAARELKANWQRIQAEAGRTGSRAAKGVRKTAKKAVTKARTAAKKSVKKAAKKAKKAGKKSRR